MFFFLKYKKHKSSESSKFICDIFVKQEVGLLENFNLFVAFVERQIKIKCSAIWKVFSQGYFLRYTSHVMRLQKHSPIIIYLWHPVQSNIILRLQSNTVSRFSTQQQKGLLTNLAKFFENLLKIYCSTYNSELLGLGQNSIRPIIC